VSYLSEKTIFFAIEKHILVLPSQMKTPTFENWFFLFFILRPIFGLGVKITYYFNFKLL